MIEFPAIRKIYIKIATEAQILKEGFFSAKLHIQREGLDTLNTS